LVATLQDVFSPTRIDTKDYTDKQLQNMINRRKKDPSYVPPRDMKEFKSLVGQLGMSVADYKALFNKAKSAKQLKDLLTLHADLVEQAKVNGGEYVNTKGETKIVKPYKPTFMSYRKAATHRIRQEKADMLNNPRRRRKSRKMRRNPSLKGFRPLSKLLGLVSKVQSKVAQFPIVKHVAFAVTPIALGAGVYYVHRALEPYISDALNSTVGQVPVLKETLRFPYTSTGVVAGLVLGYLAKKNYVSGQSASIVAGSAITVGMAMDLFMRPVAETAVSVVAQEPIAKKPIAYEPEAFSGYGDGGQYIIGRDSTALGSSHMGELIHQDTFIHMNGMYGDASMADAKMCTCHMTPDEVSATKAGKAFFFQKFGMPSNNLNKSQSIYSKYAGKHGHRYGWCIKMIGFENFQKIASLPEKQREIVISQLQQQAIASIPQMIAQLQQDNSLGALNLDGSFNGVQGADDSYGALMFAGSGY
jgi:hypothetical protein